MNDFIEQMILLSWNWTNEIIFFERLKKTNEIGRSETMNARNKNNEFRLLVIKVFKIPFFLCLFHFLFCLALLILYIVRVMLLVIFAYICNILGKI